MPPLCTHTPLYLIYPPTYPTGLNKSVPQMTLLMPLAEIPLFYPWTCGSKAESWEREGKAAEQERRKKIISLFDQKNTSSFMYWQRWKAHGDGGSLAARIKDPSVDDFTIWLFWKHRISLWHGKPFEDTNKKHIQEILWLLCSSDGVLLRGIENLKMFFSRLWNGKRQMTLAAHGHQASWCPGHSRWRRKSRALYGETGGHRLAALFTEEMDKIWLIPVSF